MIKKVSPTVRLALKKILAFTVAARAGVFEGHAIVRVTWNRLSWFQINLSFVTRDTARNARYNWTEEATPYPTNNAGRWTAPRLVHKNASRLAIWRCPLCHRCTWLGHNCSLHHHLCWICDLDLLTRCHSFGDCYLHTSVGRLHYYVASRLRTFRNSYQNCRHLFT